MILGDLPRLVRSSLATCPVEQFQVILERDTQEAFIARSQSLFVCHRTVGARIQSHRGQPSISGDLRTLPFCGVLSPFLQLFGGGGFQDGCRLSLGDRQHGSGRGFDFLAFESLDAIAGGSVPGFFQRFGHSGANRVQIDVHATGQQGRFVDDALGAKTTLPEGAGALILEIGQSGDGFREGFHEPGDIRQALPDGCDALSVVGEDIHIVGGGVAELFIDTFTGENLKPAEGDLSIGPGFDDIGSIS